MQNHLNLRCTSFWHARDHEDSEYEVEIDKDIIKRSTSCCLHWSLTRQMESRQGTALLVIDENNVNMVKEKGGKIDGGGSITFDRFVPLTHMSEAMTQSLHAHRKSAVGTTFSLSKSKPLSDNTVGIHTPPPPHQREHHPPPPNTRSSHSLTTFSLGSRPLMTRLQCATQHPSRSVADQYFKYALLD